MTRRDEIVTFIAEYAVDHHNAPSVRDIAEQFDLSYKTVYEHLQQLISEGRLEQLDRQWKLPKAEYLPPPID